MQRREASPRLWGASSPEGRPVRLQDVVTAAEDFPWGERVIKVNKKVFVFLGHSDGGLSMATKLPNSGVAALTLPFAEPTGYGLGKSGWVTAHFNSNQKAPVQLLCRWIDESYRAVAPKKLIDRLPSSDK